jgi:hypothetical protein
MAPHDIIEYVFERDRLEFSLGDTLDVKTGLILASLTFLAIQSGSLIDGHQSLNQTIAQIVAVFSLVIGGALAVVVLWPRAYDREAEPDSYDQWLAQLADFKARNPTAESYELVPVRLEAAKQRVRKNIRINQEKSRWMFYSFYCLIVAFVANVATLVMRLF